MLSAEWLQYVDRNVHSYTDQSPRGARTTMMIIVHCYSYIVLQILLSSATAGHFNAVS